MLPFELSTPRETACAIAERVRELRLHRGWTQGELAHRAGLATATYVRFERTGQIALDRLLKIAVALDAGSGFESLFAPPPARSLAELAARGAPSGRRRGRRSDADR